MLILMRDTDCDAIIAALGGDHEVSRRITDERAKGNVADAQSYRDAAAMEYFEDGKVEIDNEAIVSFSDEGAYVMAWVWVDRDKTEGPATE